MAEDDTISYDDSEESAPQQNTSQQNAGQGSSQQSANQGSSGSGQSPSQQNAGQQAAQSDTGTGQTPAKQSTDRQQQAQSQQNSGSTNDSAQSSSQQRTEEEGIVEEEIPTPDRSNIVKASAAEAVSETADNAYDKLMEVGAKGERKAADMRVVAAAVIIVVILAAAFLLFRGTGSANTTNTTTTTIKQINYQLSSCSVINSPGRYTVPSSISTKISDGACIVIKSSNVRLTGSNVQITGNGPFVNAKPYTYGILVENASNVSVQGFNITKFSYAVYFENSSHVSINDSFVGNSTISDVYVSDTPYASVSNDVVYGASDPDGAVLIGTGSNHTAITNSIVEFNAYYGTATYSSDTVFHGDTFLGNQVDLYCGAGIPAYSSSGSYSGSKCSVNRQCNFATCTASNYDFSPASYNLSDQVTTCGALSSPGIYTLDSNLNLAYYINVSRSHTACLTVLSPNVKLNCDGKSITNAFYGVYGNRIFNLSLENCNFSNDTYGSYLNASSGLNFSNVSYSKGTYGIYLSNDTFANITDSHYSGNAYGAYLGSSVAYMNGVTAENNTYGIATDGSTTGVLHNATVLRNKIDLYCSATSYNRSGLLSSGVSCGSSDCNWAAGLCTTKVLPPLAAYPINSCTLLSVSGNYSLNTNLIPTGTCIKFGASNIKLNCNGHLLSYDGSSQTASAFSVSSVSNITLINCNVDNFPYGFSAQNSSGILLARSVFSQAHTAVNLYNVTLSYFDNVSAYNYSQYGMHANRLRQSSVTDNLAYSLSDNATGFALEGNSTHNIFLNNTASDNRKAGFVFDSSNENLVANNTANSNAEDYACNPASSGLYAELNGVNRGLTKAGCVWLVELPISSLRQSCTAINTVNGYHILYDMLYTYGSTCFSIYNSNKTTLTDGSYINCEGHTIYASNGGIFARIFNTSNIEIENCFLKNFTEGVVSSAKSTSIINSTIANSVNGIVLNGANGSTIKDVNIFNASEYGILLNKSADDAVSNVYVRNATTGINFNAFLSTLGSSSVYGSALGIYCPALSASGNRDLGSNSCSTTNCSWLTSTSCKA